MVINFRVQPHSPIPYYRQIEDWICEQIRTGDLRPGDAIENEIALARALGVSRITVRQALDHLAARGLLVRKRGLGTFVAEPRRSFVLTRPHLRSLTEEMAAGGLRVTARTLHQEVEVPPAEVQSQLHLPPEAKVVMIRRLRFAEGKPLCIETCYHPFELFPALAWADLTDCSIYEFLEQQYHRRPVSARDTLVADTAAPETARWLQIEPGAPVMRIQRVAYDGQQIPIEYSHTVFRADQHQIVIEYQS
ncbi:MAG: GntR family transcriptional regulator [Anaerolineales bacterium]|nr:GntR family transcriptional regulator [Anaerolineales bacterium]MCS7248997.1 GntR family transcriptional regulator [Anaerolineales bacterium]MDW8162810.1 GntR family transcriptional regulator [Anaerolineales bacterium]MDW8447836.1 GntR family transcriptional regulator [Anaerolineales bacterium]